ncbi:MAG: hypothetical protein VX492_04150 [Candidatus Thermoplasmatota archaeon]|nr:hypothetical protein [Candidatus Thermoplasmatota archaeon]
MGHLLSADAWMWTIAVIFPAYVDFVVEQCQFVSTWNAPYVGQ